MRIALATWSGLPELNDNDRALVAALREHGASAVPAVWDSQVDWRSFNAVVIRSCWDYHRRRDEFLHWIAQLERAGVRVHNPPELLRWNSHKGYLSELAEQGVAVVPTIHIKGGAISHALTDARGRGWHSVVVKPAVSASAEGVVVLDLNAGEIRPPDLVDDGDYLVQPLIEALRTTGEIDVIYLDGECSHAVLRPPLDVDGHERAGKVRLIEPSPAALDAADRVVRLLSTEPVYCRVDLVIADGEPLLMEVELVEPELYLALAPGAARRFADAVLSRR